MFSVACCRRVWHLIPVAAARRCIEVAERCADGAAEEEERSAVWAAAYTLAEKQKLEGLSDWWEASDEAAGLAVAAAVGAIHGASAEEVAENANAAVGVDSGWLPAGRSCWIEEGFRIGTDEEFAQSLLVREIFGNPFRPVTISPAVLAWNDGLVVRLAQAIYEDRQLPAGMLNNGRLAVVADALEEAGCTDANILGHCRSDGEHVRGCWVIDGLLGKS